MHGIAWLLMLAFASVASAQDSAAAASDWPQWRGPHRDALCTETGLLKDWPKDGPPLAWKGTDIGINVYIDRALAGAWGKGDRLYMQGPWKPGAPSQGYQSPLTPAQLYRAGIEATNAHCRKTYGKTFDRLTEQQREEVLVGLSTAKIAFDNGLPVRQFWAMLYQTVMEGMFSDPIYGGNRNKAGWKLIGFPGAIAVHRDNVEKYKGKKFPADNPLSIADMS